MASIRTNFDGIQYLINTYHSLNTRSGANLKLNVFKIKHFDANLSAILLAINHKLNNEKDVRFTLELSGDQHVFKRNGLMAKLDGSEPIIDDRESTIPVRSFDTQNDAEYTQYLKQDFLQQRGLKKLTQDTKDMLKDHFIEIFTNADIHAQTLDPIFTCGQYFPQSSVLCFTLVDLGQGFLPAIQNKTMGKVSNDVEAIIWATSGANTTKNAEFGPGGQGLKNLRKYCEEQDGKLIICSGSGLVSFQPDGIRSITHNKNFPGSIVNIIFSKT